MKPYPKIPTAFERNALGKVQVARIKSPAIANIRRWSATEKLDGTNIRISFFADDAHPEGGAMKFGGRTDAAQTPMDLIEYLHETFRARIFADYFLVNQFLTTGESVTLYGEGVGPGIQKNGARYGDHKHFVLFDVKNGDGLTGWLDDDQIDDVAKGVGAIRAPRLGVWGHRHPGDPLTFNEAIALVANNDLPSVYGADIVEGIVLRPWGEPLYDRRGHRVIAKLKGCDF